MFVHAKPENSELNYNKSYVKIVQIIYFEYTFLLQGMQKLYT